MTRSAIRRAKALVAALALVCSMTAAQQPVAAPAKPAQIHDQRVLNFPLQGTTVVETKTVDASGRVSGTAVAADGTRADISAMLAHETALRAANPAAKLDEALTQLIASPRTGPVDVVLWLVQDPAAVDGLRAQMSREIDASDKTANTVREIEKRFTPLMMAEAQRVTSEFTRGAGGALRIRSVSTTAPVVFATVEKEAIFMVASLPEVDTVYLETSNRKDDNLDANKTHRTDRVHDYGVRGRGIRVAMLEDNGVDPACPYLNIAGWFNPGTPDPDNHIHGTSGCVASQLASRLGSAPDVSLFSANATTYSDTNVTAAADWIATNNMDITSMSFGGNYSGAMQYLDRYFDYQSRVYADSYVAAAGNDGNSVGSEWVGSPGTAWNVLTIGSHTDGGNGDYTGDVMSSFSSWRNPGTGCNKPNLAANGQDVDTLGQAPTWLTDNYDGTSFAAPHASGNLANAMVNNGTIIGYPEAAMALMMATAWHNIEGSTQNSDKDGAGGLNGLAAYRASLAGRVTGTSLSTTSFSTNGYYVYNIYLKGGDRTRVCFSWDSQANAAYTTNVLNADLDIYIYAGVSQTSGTYFGGSASFNNNYELVEFTPPSTGWYSVAVNDYRFNGTSEFVGLAWSQKYADTSEFTLREWSPETSATSGSTIGDTAYYMDFIAPNSPSAATCASRARRSATASASRIRRGPRSSRTSGPTCGSTLTGGPTWFWSGFTGTLNSGGITFSNRMAIPNAAFLIGYELYHVGFTFDPAYPDTVKEVSEVHTFKFWPAPTVQTPSDDGSIAINLPFTFRYYGVDYTSLYLNMNGNVSFGAAHGTFTESVAGLLAGAPKICALWDDLGPHQTGSQGAPIVRTRLVGGPLPEFVAEWINVPEFGATGANTIRLTLGADNSIRIEYLDCSLQDAIVGISPGNNISTATEIDLSKNGEAYSGTNAAMFEQFTGAGDNFDLASHTIYYSKVRFVPTSASATNYRLELDLQ